jgi:hypothetical protein
MVFSLLCDELAAEVIRPSDYHKKDPTSGWDTKLHHKKGGEMDSRSSAAVIKRPITTRQNGKTNSTTQVITGSGDALPLQI